MTAPKYAEASLGACFGPMIIIGELMNANCRLAKNRTTSHANENTPKSAGPSARATKMVVAKLDALTIAWSHIGTNPEAIHPRCLDGKIFESFT